MIKLNYVLGLFTILTFFSCSQNEESNEITSEPTVEIQDDVVLDQHSYANTHQVNSTHLALDLVVDFEKQVLYGSVEHTINNKAKTDRIIFDAYDLKISKVEIDNGLIADFKLGPKDDLLGSQLEIAISPETEKVKIYYETSPNSKALQWLNPQQTANKLHPFLFSQGEAVLTRSWIPCQDTPSNRITYSAKMKVPANLMAVMSAENAQVKNDTGTYTFEMTKPIPCYLIALAVGDLEFASLGERTGVYADPTVIDKAVYEFADVEKMVIAAEGLYGDYKWGRYDILVLPPSFPFGGMENPKLTFATPTILAGDRSLVSLIAHELAHSWSGNLVTNATWDDFWLNEGFTVYFENRIMEEVYGVEYANMLLSIEHQELMHENDDILSGDHPEDSHLKLDLAGRDPDDGMTAIAYVKGALFLKTLEATVGRPVFDEFIANYFDDHEFQTMTTDRFLVYLDDNLLQPNNVDFNTDEWVYGKGIPDNCVKINSNKFELVEEKIELLKTTNDMASLGISKADWSTQEWIHFIRQLPKDITIEKMKSLDQTFNFSNSGNAEIMCEWYLVSIQKGYKGINPYLENFLINVGRRKFLEPIYEALAKTEEGLAQAKKIYEKARPNYHSISFTTIDAILNWKKDM